MPKPIDPSVYIKMGAKQDDFDLAELDEEEVKPKRYKSTYNAKDFADEVVGIQKLLPSYEGNWEKAKAA